MHPHIDRSAFGSIVIEGTHYDHDVVIRSDGSVGKRKKKLSKKVTGTSHLVSLAEAEHVWRDGASTVVVGAGHNGVLKLSKEARNFFESKGCEIVINRTPVVIRSWNKLDGNAVGLLHVTC